MQLDPDPAEWRALATAVVDYLTERAAGSPRRTGVRVRRRRRAWSPTRRSAGRRRRPGARWPSSCRCSTGRPAVGLNPSTPGYLAFIPGSGLVSAGAGRADRRRAQPLHRAGVPGPGAGRAGGRPPAVARGPLRPARDGRRPVHLRRVAGDVLRAGRRPLRPPAGGLPARHALRHRPGAPLGDQGGPARGLPGRRPCASCPTTGPSGWTSRRCARSSSATAAPAVLRRRQRGHHQHRRDRPARRDRRRCAPRERLWLHVDGAYGAAFQLTERGRDRLRGIERADSITLDPHKGFFLPFGTGCLLVRDPATLRAAHSGDDAHYLQDIDAADLPDFADLGPELTRPFRGLPLWLPLHLHGVAAFRDGAGREARPRAVDVHGAAGGARAARLRRARADHRRLPVRRRRRDGRVAPAGQRRAAGPAVEHADRRPLRRPGHRAEPPHRPGAGRGGRGRDPPPRAGALIRAAASGAARRGTTRRSTRPSLVTWVERMRQWWFTRPAML